MGNVACCKKPNEVIEDRDLFKKTTLKKENNFDQDISKFTDQDIGFLKNQNREGQDMNTNFHGFNNYSENKNDDLNYNHNENNNINYNQDENFNNNDNIKQNENYIKNNLEEKEDHKLIDLEEKVERQPTGPSDNLRNRKLRQSQPRDVSCNNDNKNSKNEIEQKQNQNTNDIYKYKQKNKEIQAFNDNKRSEQVMSTNIDINKNSYYNSSLNNNQIQTKNFAGLGSYQAQQLNDNEEKAPMDRRRRNNISNNSINESNQIRENVDNFNQSNKNEVKDQKNFQQKLEEENYKYYIQPTNQSVEFVNNSKYFGNSSSQNAPNDRSQEANKELTINEKTSNEINNKKIYLQSNQSQEQVPQNSKSQKINQNNDDTNAINIQQNLQESDDQDNFLDMPKDSNEIYQNQNQGQIKQNMSYQKSQNIDRNENNENSQIKEAYIQKADGQIIPTKQLSDSEITILYNKCLSKGETEPDDDFSPDTYKEFYPENDPFFNFDKGEVTQGQIISNPDDPNNLEIYEGEINENNKKHGYGICTTPLYVRKGTWRNGQFTGWGRESRRNRDVLEGKFINGLVNGKGVLKNNKGNLYFGDFVNSQREGYGELHTNRIHYKGEFKEDKLDGKGVIEFLKEGHKYEGEFKNNEINRKGIFKWKNGDVYQGEMSNGKMNGHGTYTYNDGQIYDGEYINGLRDGKGRIIFSNQIIYEGEFKNGHRFENGNLIDSKRNIIDDNNIDNNQEVFQ